mmetsp:Transcript_25343/g.79930  ORF Transcript_25343/g.79930 Transcript_25343/m.79930 type:complete len:274 (-) Transcript_25343:298-1119(-)
MFHRLLRATLPSGARHPRESQRAGEQDRPCLPVLPVRVLPCAAPWGAGVWREEGQEGRGPHRAGDQQHRPGTWGRGQQGAAPAALEVQGAQGKGEHRVQLPRVRRPLLHRRPLLLGQPLQQRVYRRLPCGLRCGVLGARDQLEKDHGLADCHVRGDRGHTPALLVAISLRAPEARLHASAAAQRHAAALGLPRFTLPPRARSYKDGRAQHRGLRHSSEVGGASGQEGWRTRHRFGWHRGRTSSRRGEYGADRAKGGRRRGHDGRRGRSSCEPQ